MRHALVAFGIAWLACVPSARAILVPDGPGSAETACFGAFDVEAPAVSGTSVTCIDGDPSCDQDGAADGACTFGIRLCANVSGIKGCHRTHRVSTMKLSPTRYGNVPLPELPALRRRCGASGQIVVRLKRKVCGGGKGKAILKMRTRRQSGRHRNDVDKLKLLCLAAPGTCPGGNCVRRVSLAVSDTGQDFDVGTQHNLRWPGSWGMSLCLKECSADGSADCPAYAGYPSFGPAIPLLAGDVPVCLIHRLSFSGTVNPGTGAIEGDATIFADVHVTSATQICPRCIVTSPGEYATCDSGPNAGQACTPAATATVPGAPGDPIYPVSWGCPPDPAALAGTIALPAKLTTGTSTLAADACEGPTPNPDACPAGECTDGVCTDCASAEGDCIAPRGGVQQACCSDDTARPCFPAELVRSGVAVPPAPAFPDPTYPKVGAGTVLVSTFCVPRTDAGVASVMDGGRGALILPVTATWY